MLEHFRINIFKPSQKNAVTCCKITEEYCNFTAKFKFITAKSRKNMEKKKLISKKALTVDAEERAFQAVQKQSDEKERKVQRITVDMPIYLYDQLKGETEKKGYSITGFMLALVRKHFEE